MYSAEGEYVEFGHSVLLEGPVEVSIKEKWMDGMGLNGMGWDWMKRMDGRMDVMKDTWMEGSIDLSRKR